MPDSIPFRIKNYSFDATNEGGMHPTLRIFGTCQNSTVEVVITNPTNEMVMLLMETYDRRYELDRTDITLIGSSDFHV